MFVLRSVLAFVVPAFLPSCSCSWSGSVLLRIWGSLSLWFIVVGSPYGAGTRSRGLGRSKGRVWPHDATSPGEILAATVRGNREQAFLWKS
ncbi:hypothetical protein LXA43DRAFT_1029802 [Ganoderma leucocontextum]|nr:hypothetical protein LXA43DRAFT_1029802 [Ganoderma leucocontextum]